MTGAQTRADQAELFALANGDERIARTRNSMLWAAYGDALGFISELVDKRGLLRRTKGAPLDRLMAWTRRVGGRGGVDVELPAGCWSDDTQLRMAVSRAIGPHGFDVESFARIELPVWPAYALGGGRASKAAAANLAKSDSPWYANAFDGWASAGGNGAAMRIQPHVWASADLDGDHLRDVIFDCICTHGHPARSWERVFTRRHWRTACATDQCPTSAHARTSFRRSETYVVSSLKIQRWDRHGLGYGSGSQTNRLRQRGGQRSTNCLTLST